MTGVAVDWVTLSTPEFVAWTRLVGVRLPFPLSSGALSYVAGPGQDDLDRTLNERGLANSAVLAATRGAFAQPRLAVYAVRATPDGAEAKFYSLAGRNDDAVLILLDADKMAVRQVADTELAAGVVGALPAMTPMPFAPCEVAVAGMIEVDAAIDSGVSPRTLRTQMSHLGFSAELIALRERVGNAPGPSGAIGALSYAPDAQPRHSARSSTWREYDAGAVLQVERGPRRGEPVIALMPGAPDALFRAAVDAVSSLYEGEE